MHACEQGHVRVHMVVQACVCACERGSHCAAASEEGRCRGRVREEHSLAPALPSYLFGEEFLLPTARTGFHLSLKNRSSSQGLPWGSWKVLVSWKLEGPALFQNKGALDLHLYGAI